MIELIVVMIIVGILSVVVLPRFASLGDFEARGHADQVQALLRFAQKEAIAERRTVFINFGATPPAFCRKTACSAAACLPADNIALPASYKAPATAVTLTPASALCFDALGQPLTTANALAATQTIAVKDEAGATIRNIVIEARTGYVH